ncbi:MAG: RNA polymerase sigma factor (sigma-70 family) [Bacteroidia bacterium]|jgi:RNA polymerase sigma factor (sigma-70 family)
MKTVLSVEMTEKSRTSVTQTIKLYGAKLGGFIKSKVGNNEEAKDILQDVWHQLSRLTNIDDIENMSGWLYNVSRNRITDSFRKKRPESLEDLSFEDEEGERIFKEVLLLDDSASPELALFKEVFWKALFKALDELPEKQREAFVLNEIEDMTLQEIADQNGESIKTIISRKRYAVIYLRTQLEHLYGDLLD